MVRARGEGGIHWSQARQRWVATWRGRKQYGTTKAEAAAKLKVMRDQEGSTQLRTVGQILDWFTDEHLAQRVAAGSLVEATAEDYAFTATLWRTLRKRRWDQLTAAEVDRHLEQLRTVRTSRGRGYSPSTRYRALVCLRQAYKQAARKGLIPRGRHAPEDATPPRVTIEEPPLVDPANAKAVLDQLQDDRDYLLVVVMLTLGIRVSEALGLTWDVIDLDAGIYRLHRQLARTGPAGARTWTFAPRKGRADVTKALPRLAVDALRQQQAIQRRERLAAGPFWEDPLPGLVFRRADGQPCWSTTVLNKIAQACVDVGVERMTTHQFCRHGHATLLRLAGGTLTDVQDALDHAQASTSQRYTHIAPAVHRRNADRIDGVLG